MIIYPSDLTDKQWDVIKNNFEYGNYGKYPVRVLVNAVFYVIKTGLRIARR